MANTYAILRQDTTNVSLNLDSMDPADISASSGPGVNDSGQLIAEYTCNLAGDYRYKTKVIARCNAITSAAKPRSFSISLVSWASDTDADSVVVDIKPITVTLTVNMPATYVESADLGTMVMNLVSLALGTITTAEPDLAPVIALMSGEPGELW